MSQALLVFPAFAATAVSVTGLTWLAKAYYDPKRPRSLSEIATSSKRSMTVFRSILYPCSILFGITNLALIAPLSGMPVAIAMAAIVMCGCEIVLATIPATHGLSKRLHNIFANTMGAAMFALAVLYWAVLAGAPRRLMVVVVVVMALLFVGTVVDRKRFVFYELPYIYLSHLSILIVAVSLLSRH
jgi:hypothetical protein